MSDNAYKAIYRKNVVIKTKFITIKELHKKWIEDYSNVSYYLGIGGWNSRDIDGHMYKDKTFRLFGMGRFNRWLKYVGLLEERDDGVYMVGDIRPRLGWSILLHGLLIIIGAATIYRIIRYGEYAMLLGVAFFGWPVAYLHLSESLYDNLITYFAKNGRLVD